MTDCGGDREKNMVEFARLGLELLKKAILTRADGKTNAGGKI